MGARQPLPDPQWVQSAASCFGCGYSLVGLETRGLCPECGAPYEARQLILAGVPGKTVGAPAWRRAAWILLGISACFSLHVAAFFLLFVSWVVSLMWLIVLIGSFVYMIATSKRERRAAERLVITPYGIARMALVPTPPKTGGNGMEPGLSMLHDADHARPDTLLIPWGDANTLEFRRLSPVWCSIRIGHIAAGKKKMRVLFSAGIRCPQATGEMVRAAIESNMRREAGIVASEEVGGKRVETTTHSPDSESFAPILASDSRGLPSSTPIPPNTSSP
ncbi:MAG: hypothetical protein H7210_03210 [Pyrinomonadaceae bacterium]|nr:hypothetical protein [Phycisphaerales bacterium]